MINYDKIRTGDIFTVHADSLISLLAYYAVGISHVHVCMAVWVSSLSPLTIELTKINDNCKLYIWETDPIPRIDHISGKHYKGCRLIPFQIMVDSSCSILQRRLHRSIDIRQCLYDQIKKRHQQSFPSAGLAMFKASIDYDYEPYELDDDKRLLHCTELMAECLNMYMSRHYQKNNDKLHMASPFWFISNGPFKLLFMDDCGYEIVNNGWSTRAYVIHVSAAIILTLIIVSAYYGLNCDNTNKRTITTTKT